MNIVDSGSYNNQIYKAIVVNENYQNDPNNEGRVQIYIPSMQLEYSNIYKQYMNSGNKEQSQYYTKFPWAVSLVKDLTNGNVVYGNFINNDFSQFIILGLQANVSSNDTINVTGSSYNVTGNTLTKYTTAIIIENEVDNFNHNDYLNGTIPDSCYSQIECDDNGAFSIGLIQWHANNAFDILLKIRNELPDWTNYWPDKDLYIYKDLNRCSAININYSKYKLTYGSSEYNSIKNMLQSDVGKKVQLEHSSDFVYSYITDLQNNYNISNPAVIIWLSDLMNQYGTGITNTKKKAAEFCNSTTDNILALNMLIEWCEQNYASYDTYKERRKNTKDYVVELESQGKLTTDGLISGGYDSENINSLYCYPFRGTAKITATWGYGGYHNMNGGADYYSRGMVVIAGEGNGYHTGIDFGLAIGTPVYAVTSGTTYSIYPSYGLGMCLDADDGYKIYYGHLSKHLKIGRVEKGDIIALSGNTAGASGSTGPHLHFEIRKSPYNYSGVGGGDDINPLPFIGINQNQELYEKSITFD